MTSRPEPQTDSDSQTATTAASPSIGLAWYSRSYPFVLMTLFLTFHEQSSLAAITLVLGIVNLSQDKWYRHGWAWLVLIPLAVACLGKTVFTHWIEQML